MTPMPRCRKAGPVMNTAPQASSKISAAHLRRGAYLYVRQSTIKQVLTNTESTLRQYDLRGRAIAFGWSSEQIIVIDIDQGHSGASAADREGFQRLVADVGMGKAGIVLGLECSRLARNNADWHRLLEICALSGTLICDEDGLYDPRDFNDRMLPQLSDPSQPMTCEWPGHIVDDASLTWRRRGRRAAGSVAGSGVAWVPAQREQLAVGGRKLGLGLGQLAAQLGQPGRQGGDDAGCAGAAGFAGWRASGGCRLAAAEPFDAGSQFGVAVKEVHRHAACGGDPAEGDGLAGLGELTYPGLGAGGGGLAFGGCGLAQCCDLVLVSGHRGGLLACG